MPVICAYCLQVCLFFLKKSKKFRHLKNCCNYLKIGTVSFYNRVSGGGGGGGGRVFGFIHFEPS